MSLALQVVAPDAWRRAVRLCRAGMLACGCLAAVSPLGAAAQGTGGGDRSPPCTGLTAGASRTVTRVIDGETLALDDGSELRLIGALAPRAIDAGAQPGAWPLEIEAAAELAALALGKPVELHFGGERSDRHGRLQAHAVLAGAARRWVQGYLLEQGLARAFTQAGNRACAKELLEAENVGRESRRGLWADAAYQVRSAQSPRELAAYRGTFQVVEGRISRTAQTRGAIYLNFGPGRSAFAVSLRRADLGLLGADSRDIAGLEGADVRVRGWIEMGSRGPVVDLSTAGLLERRVRPDGRSGAAVPEPPVPESKPPGLIETGR